MHCTKSVIERGMNRLNEGRVVLKRYNTGYTIIFLVVMMNLEVHFLDESAFLSTNARPFSITEIVISTGVMNT